MTSDLEKWLGAVEQATLTPLVQRMLENESAKVMNWRYQPVEGGFGANYGVYRFQGEAQAGGETLGWSLILKVIGPAVGSQEPTALNYWKREGLVYQSGLLNNLPGDLVAPRCIAVVEYPGQVFWLWLEDVAESSDKVWSLERYRLAARHLGQFNGAYLVNKPIPKVSWLSTKQLRQRLALAEPGIAKLPQLSQDPLFEGLAPGDSIERMLRLWAARDRFLAILDRLPQTLCHHEAVRHNLIARDDQSGQAQTVAIDWAMMGTGWVGQEIVSLFAGSLAFVVLETDKIADLDALVFAGYVAGLREAGWRGDVQLVRFGYAATAGLSSIAERASRWLRIANRVAALPAGAERPRLLNPGGPAQAIAKNLYLLRLGEEAYALNDALS